MKKLILGLLLLISTPVYANTISLGTISADAIVSGMNDNFTTIANVVNGNIEGSTDSGASVSNIKADSIFRINMADDADPATFAKETESITVDTTSSSGAFVYSGGTPATDTDLTSDISACVAYINGIRVSKSATAQTYIASRDGYVDLSQTGVYTLSSVANGAAAPVVAANSARLAKVVTNGTQITSVTDLANRRLPGLLIPAQYRSGMRVSMDSTATITVFPGTVEVNSTMINKTSTTTLNLATAGDYAGGASLRATSTYGYVGIDASGNLKMHTTAPTHDNYAVSTTAGKKRYATWSATVYRILGWFYMNATGSGQLDAFGVGNIKEADVSNAVVQGATSTQSVSTTTSDTTINNTTFNYYCSGGPILIHGNITGIGDAIRVVTDGIYVDSVEKTQSRSGSYVDTSATGLSYGTSPHWLELTPSQGTHTISIGGRVNAGTWTVSSRDVTVVEL